jgi:hypothetical protein
MDFEKTFATCPICYSAVQEHLMANHIEYHAEELGGEDEEITEAPTRYTIDL